MPHDFRDVGGRTQRRTSTREAPVKDMWGEFKAFALGGNMLDLALAIVRR